MKYLINKLFYIILFFINFISFGYSLDLDYIYISSTSNEINFNDEDNLSKNFPEKKDFFYFYLWNNKSNLTIYSKDIETNKINICMLLELKKIKNNFVLLNIYDNDKNIINSYNITLLTENIITINNDKYYLNNESYNKIKKDVFNNLSLKSIISFFNNTFYFQYYPEVLSLIYFIDNNYYIKRADIQFKFLWDSNINYLNSNFEYSNNNLIKSTFFDNDLCSIYENNITYINNYIYSNVYFTKRENQHDNYHLIINKINKSIVLSGESFISTDAIYYVEFLYFYSKNDFLLEKDILKFMEELKY